MSTRTKDVSSAIYFTGLSLKERVPGTKGSSGPQHFGQTRVQAPTYAGRAPQTRNSSLVVRTRSLLVGKETRPCPGESEP